MIYEFELTGLTPLLVHADDVEASDRLGEWRKASENRDISRAGDDRSPPWTWQTYLYTDGACLTIPSDNLMVALRQAGATETIKGNKTYKSLTQSGLVIPDEHLPILVGGNPIDAKAVSMIDGTFREQREAAEQLGFKLFVKRAKVGQSKHVRVRPRFDRWSICGKIEVTTDRIEAKLLQKFFEIAGNSIGIGDWRPSAPKSPGPFGRFEAILRLLKNGKK